MTMRRLALLALLACAPVIAQEEHAEPTEHAEEAEEEVPTSLKIANFVLLAGGLGYMLGKYLPGAFRDRTAEIQKDIALAQAAKREADERAAQMEAKLKSLAADIEAFKASAALEMKQEGERIRQETLRQVQRVESQAAREVENAGKTARRELSEHASRLALKMAEDRIRERADADTEAGLVESFIAELDRKGAKN